METIAIGVILASILATLTVSVCLAFDEAFGNWHVRPFGGHRWHGWYRRHRFGRFGRHGKHRIHKRDIKLSLGKTAESNLHSTYSDILENQDLANSYIVNKANIAFDNTEHIFNDSKLELINNVIDFAKPEGKTDITIH